MQFSWLVRIDWRQFLPYKERWIKFRGTCKNTLVCPIQTTMGRNWLVSIFSLQTLPTVHIIVQIMEIKSSCPIISPQTILIIYLVKSLAVLFQESITGEIIDNIWNMDIVIWHIPYSYILFQKNYVSNILIFLYILCFDGIPDYSSTYLLSTLLVS